MRAKLTLFAGVWLAVAASATVYASGIDIHLKPTNCVAHGVSIEVHKEPSGTHRFHVTVTPRIGAFPFKEIRGQLIVHKGSNVIASCDVANGQILMPSGGAGLGKHETLEYSFKVSDEFLADSVFTITWAHPQMPSYQAWWIDLGDFQDSGRSAQPDAAPEPPTAAPVQDASENMNPRPQSEAPADGGGR